MTSPRGKSAPAVSVSATAPRWRSYAPVSTISDDLRDREAELVVRREEVRAEADSGAGPEVAEDRALLELRVDGRRLRHVDDDRAAAPRRVPRRVHLEAGGVGEVDEELRLAQRVLADALDADLLDEVVAGGSRHVRRRVRRAREEARGAGRVLHLLLERERPRVRLPAGVGRLETLGEIGPHVQPAVRRPAAQPLHRAADREVDAERGEVDRDDPRRLVAVEDHVRADLVRAAHDRLDVLDLGRP